MPSRRNRLISHPPPIPSWGYSGSKWNYIPDATGLGWNDPLPARCFGAWVPPEPANSITVDWRNMANDGTGTDKGLEETDGQWRVTARDAVYAGTIEVGDLFTRLGTLRDTALAVASTALRLPAVRARLLGNGRELKYSNASAQAGRQFLMWGVADANGEPETHLNGSTGSSQLMDMDCTPGGGIVYEMRNIRTGAWQEDIDLDPESQTGAGINLRGESGILIVRNCRVINTTHQSGFESQHKFSNECEGKLHTAFFATDSVLKLNGNNALEQGQYNVSAGPWLTIRTVSGPQYGHGMRWASDGMGLNCSLVGRSDDTLSAGVGYQTPLNLMPAAFVHIENLAAFPSIGNVAGFTSRAAIGSVGRRSSSGQATSPFMLGVERAKAASWYLKDENAIERWRYQTFEIGGEFSDHYVSALEADASGTSVQASTVRGCLVGGSGSSTIDISTDTTSNAWELVLIDTADGKRETVTATFSSLIGARTDSAIFTTASSLSATYPASSSYIAMRRTAAHPSGEANWDKMALNEPAYNLRHPLCPWFDAVVPGVTPDGPWAEMGWPTAHNKSLHNVYVRPLHNALASASCAMEFYGSHGETYMPDTGTNRMPYPPGTDGSWPPPPVGWTAGSWTDLGFAPVSDDYATVYGTDGSGGNGVNGTAVRDLNPVYLSNFGIYEDAGLANPLEGQFRHNDQLNATVQTAAVRWLDSAGDPQRVTVLPYNNVSPMPATTKTTISGAVTGSTSEPTRTVVLASSTGATVGKAIQIEMAGAMNGWGVLFDVIEAIDGTTVTLRTGATHDISDGARVAIFTKAGAPPKPWQTAEKLWERFKDFSMT